MTHDDILRMAREAGLYVGTNLSGAMLVGHAKHGSLLIHLDVDDLARFATLVAAEEREACAKECDDLVRLNRTSDTDSMWQWEECAAAIRARSTTE